jgi:hypothetical protein
LIIFIYIYNHRPSLLQNTAPEEKLNIKQQAKHRWNQQSRQKKKTYLENQMYKEFKSQPVSVKRYTDMEEVEISMGLDEMKNQKDGWIGSGKIESNRDHNPEGLEEWKKLGSSYKK